MAGKEEAAVSDGMGDKRELAVELGPGAAFLVADAEDMTEHSSDGAVKLLAQRLVQGPRLAAIKEDAEDKGLEQNALASLTQVATGPEPVEAAEGRPGLANAGVDVVGRGGKPAAKELEASRRGDGAAVQQEDR
eukprot:6261672-Karenia_brevis.AAC.1